MDIDFGQILPNPTDALYDASHEYAIMDSCVDTYGSEWLSLDDGNIGHPLPGYNEDGTAKVSGWWRCIVNVYRTGKAANDAIEKAEFANEQGLLANEKAGLAAEKAGLAEEKAEYAKSQGDYAKNMADHPSYVGNDDYWYHWNYATQSYVKGSKAKGEGVDYSTMTAAEKQELSEMVAEEVELNGGYSMHPVNEGALTTTNVYPKNSVIAIDGVVYISNKETQNLPFPMVVQENKFLTQMYLGHLCFVKASDTRSADWDIWLDASNSIRYLELEERVAKLETVINSLQLS